MSGSDESDDVRKEAFFRFIRMGDMDGVSLCSLGKERDYAVAHDPETGMTTLQTVLAGGFSAFWAELPVERFFKLAAWLLDHGADPHQVAPGIAGSDEAEEGDAGSYWFDEDENFKLVFRFECRSALSLIAETLENIDEQSKAECWSASRKWIASWLPFLKKAAASARCMGDQVPVGIFVQDLWEKVLTDKDSHDLVLQCTDGTVTAHSCVLIQASPVVRAMLKSTMVEAKTRQVQVDCSCEATTFLLELLHIGATSCKYSIATGLPALDLAHRWQVPGAVSVLERAASTALTTESFGAVAEAAVLKGLPVLRSACERFARDHDILKSDKDFLASLPEAVLQWLGEAPPNLASSRKRRFSLT